MPPTSAPPPTSSSPPAPPPPPVEEDDGDGISTPTGGSSSETGPGAYEEDPRLSVLEAEVLGEYVRLRGNLERLSTQLARLASAPSAQIGDTLRLLERKTALVCTALKSSVYSIVLQAQQDDDGGEG